jgi:hypothetical protein
MTWRPFVGSVQRAVDAAADAAPVYVKDALPVFEIVTVRFAVSPGTRFEIEISDAAALLSLLAVRVAEPNELAGFVVVAVKLALDLSAVTVRPIRTRAERAMPARRAAGLRIVWVPFLSASPFSGVSRGRL